MANGSGTGNITAKSLTITALNHSKCVGVNHVLPNNGYTIDGLVGNESIGSVSLNSTGNPSSAAVGDYAIVAYNANGGTFSSSNYDITYINGILTVNPVSVAGVVSVPSSIVCSGSSTTLSLSGYTGSIQWQTSNNGNSWNDISGANQDTYTTPSISQAIYYRTTVTSGSCAASSSQSVFLDVSQPFSAVLSGTGSTCLGGSKNLVVTMSNTNSTYTLVYSDGSNNFSVSNYTSGSSIAVSPTETKTYNLVSVTNTNGCLASTGGSATITISNASTTWNGTSWSNGEPTSAKEVIISGTFTSPGNSSSPYTLEACKLSVSNNATVVIKSGDSVSLDGPLTVVSGSFVTFNSGSNLLQKGATNNNSGSIIIKRDSAPLKRLDYTLWASPVSNQQLLVFSPNTLTNRFYNYDSNTNQYQVINPSTTNFSPTVGYLIRVPNNHPVSTPTVWTGQFTGVPNNGNFSINQQNSGAGRRFNLIGNPYPSAIDADAFINTNLANGSITGAIYFYRKTNGSLRNSYCTYTSAGGFLGNGEGILNNPNYSELFANIIQVGQGFFVETSGNNNPIVLTNDMRINSSVNRFMRASSPVERNRIWLSFSNSLGAYSQTMVAYMTGATQGYDTTIDGKLISDGEISIASLIGADSYAIQGRPIPFDVNDVVPLSIKVTNAGDYTISLDRVDGFFSNNGQIIYLKDNITGSIHDLSSGSYSFSSAAGTFDNRFEIIFQTPLSTNLPLFNESQVVIYKTSAGKISINTGSVLMSKVKIFDLNGRVLYQAKDINSSQTFADDIQSSDILLIQITSEEGIVVTKKMIFPRTSLKIDKKLEIKSQLAEDE